MNSKEGMSIVLEGISKEYPGVMALKNVSFNVTQGHIHGFLGPNGAGKSTTMRIIAGLTKATSGKLWINGHDCTKLRGKTSIGILPENSPLYLNMKVCEYLEFVANIFEVPKQNIDLVMNSCSLAPVFSRLIGNLSKGYKQRVGIAQALLPSPEIVILDEPTVGLDPESIFDIRELILSLAGKHTVLLSTHLLHEVELLCSELSIINDGIILQSGEIKEIKKRFQKRQKIILNVAQCNEQLIQNLKQIKKVNDINIKNNQDVTTFEIYANTSDREESQKLLSTIAKIAVECDLLELKEEELELEEIFKTVTQNDHQKENLR